MEFAELRLGKTRISGPCSQIVSGWVRDQRPAFAIKLILECDKADLYGYLCRFAAAAAAQIEEPEPMLQALQSLLSKNRSLVSQKLYSEANNYEMCSYRCCVCEGYAERQRMDRVSIWLSGIGIQQNYDATIYRVVDLLLKKSSWRWLSAGVRACQQVRVRWYSGDKLPCFACNEENSISLLI